MTGRFRFISQVEGGLPMRIVSVNMLSHYKASGEPDMTDRQLTLFHEVKTRPPCPTLLILARHFAPAPLTPKIFSKTTLALYC